MENTIPLTIRINNTKEQFGNILINGSIINDIDIYGMPDPIEEMCSRIKTNVSSIFSANFSNIARNMLPDQKMREESTMWTRKE